MYPHRGSYNFAGLYDDVDCVLGQPAALFPADLLAAYPTARFVATTRDEDAWFIASKTCTSKLLHQTDGTVALLWRVINQFVLGGWSPERAQSIARFRRHYAHVRETIPESQLLWLDHAEIHAKDSSLPEEMMRLPRLCSFIGFTEEHCVPLKINQHAVREQSVDAQLRAQIAEFGHEQVVQMSVPDFSTSTPMQFHATSSADSALLQVGSRAQADYAYATLLGGINAGNSFQDEYVTAASVLCETVRASYHAAGIADRPFHMVLMTLDTLSWEQQSSLRQCFDRVLPVTEVGRPVRGATAKSGGSEGSFWSIVRAKIWALSLTEYKRVVFLDADQMVGKHLDDYFFREHYDRLTPAELRVHTELQDRRAVLELQRTFLRSSSSADLPHFASTFDLDASFKALEADEAAAVMDQVPKAFYSVPGLSSPILTCMMSLAPSAQRFLDLASLLNVARFDTKHGWMDVGAFDFTPMDWPIAAVNVSARPKSTLSIPLEREIVTAATQWRKADWSFFGASADQGVFFYYYYQLFPSLGGIVDPRDFHSSVVHFLAGRKPWLQPSLQAEPGLMEKAMEKAGIKGVLPVDEHELRVAAQQWRDIADATSQAGPIAIEGAHSHSAALFSAVSSSRATRRRFDTEAFQAAYHSQASRPADQGRIHAVVFFEGFGCTNPLGAYPGVRWPAFHDGCTGYLDGEVCPLIQRPGWTLMSGDMRPVCNDFTTSMDFTPSEPVMLLNCPMAPFAALPDGLALGTCLVSSYPEGLPVESNPCTLVVLPGWETSDTLEMFCHATPGYFPGDSGQLSAFPTMTPVVGACPFPALPSGITPGDCPAPGALLDATLCNLDVMPGWGLSSGSLTINCHAGVLDPLPTAEIGCPEINPPVGFAEGTCGSPASVSRSSRRNLLQSAIYIPNGPTCDLELLSGFSLFAGSITMFCTVSPGGETRWSPYPTAGRDCVGAIVAPSGTLIGTCTNPAGLLGAGDSCLLEAVPGMEVATGSLHVICTWGVLSELPVMQPASADHLQASGLFPVAVGISTQPERVVRRSSFVAMATTVPEGALDSSITPTYQWNLACTAPGLATPFVLSVVTSAMVLSPDVLPEHGQCTLTLSNTFTSPLGSVVKSAQKSFKVEDDSMLTASFDWPIVFVVLYSILGFLSLAQLARLSLAFGINHGVITAIHLTLAGACILRAFQNAVLWGGVTPISPSAYTISQCAPWVALPWLLQFLVFGWNEMLSILKQASGLKEVDARKSAAADRTGSYMLSSIYTMILLGVLTSMTNATPSTLLTLRDVATGLNGLLLLVMSSVFLMGSHMALRSLPSSFHKSKLMGVASGVCVCFIICSTFLLHSLAKPASYASDLESFLIAYMSFDLIALFIVLLLFLMSGSQVAAKQARKRYVVRAASVHPAEAETLRAKDNKWAHNNTSIEMAESESNVDDAAAASGKPAVLAMPETQAAPGLASPTIEMPQANDSASSKPSGSRSSSRSAPAPSDEENAALMSPAHAASDNALSNSAAPVAVAAAGPAMVASGDDEGAAAAAAAAAGSAHAWHLFDSYGSQLHTGDLADVQLGVGAARRAHSWQLCEIVEESADELKLRPVDAAAGTELTSMPRSALMLQPARTVTQGAAIDPARAPKPLGAPLASAACDELMGGAAETAVAVAAALLAHSWIVVEDPNAEAHVPGVFKRGPTTGKKTRKPILPSKLSSPATDAASSAAADALTAVSSPSSAAAPASVPLDEALPGAVNADEKV